MPSRHSASLRDTQLFFAPRAAHWEEKYADDAPRYERAVQEMRLPIGATVLDLGCGTGRAMPALQVAVGAQGLVIGLDATPAMVRAGVRRNRRHMLVGDVLCLPFSNQCADAILAAGLLPHLNDPLAGLLEMARVAKPGAVLAIFHPIGRAALAARHGSVPSDDDVLAPAQLARLLTQAGWQLRRLDDAEDRYLALAVRQT